MARYIDADELFKTARDGYHSDFGRSMADLTSLREVVEDTPTADVVEVVRCSECKYAKEVKCLGCACQNKKTPWYNDEFEVCMNPTDFCSYGERRTDGGNL